jgi:cytochrome c oxidase subunit IV
MEINSNPKEADMLAWCVILFVLGILAFSDTLFNYGDIFRRVNSVIFMLVSLGLLVRTSMKMRLKRTENLSAKIEELETRVKELSSTENRKEKTGIY